MIFRRHDRRSRWLRDLKRELLGQSASIEKNDGHTVIHVGSNANISVESQWRLIDSKNIVVTDSDDCQWFGLEAPVDAIAKANERLLNETIKSVALDQRTGDLRLLFSKSLVLEIITNSSGYESWVMDIRGEHFAVGANGGLA
ncbi:MAG: hypothetical protein ACKOOL_12995 [Novosphingobium sp.]